MLAGKNGLAARIVGRPHPERRFEPAVVLGQVGHRMGPVAEPMRLPIGGQGVVVGGPESRQMGQQMGHEPAKLRQRADAALRQFERVVAHLAFEPVPPLGHAQAPSFARLGSRRTRAARASRRADARPAAAATWSRGLENPAKRRFVLNEPLFVRHVGRRLIERHRLDVAARRPCRSARESTPCDTDRCRSADGSPTPPTSRGQVAQHKVLVPHARVKQLRLVAREERADDPLAVPVKMSGAIHRDIGGYTRRPVQRATARALAASSASERPCTS